MKRKIFGALMTLIVACTLAIPAVYAGDQTIMAADVPFAFTVGSSQMPAGKYDVKQVERATLIETTDRSSHVLGLYQYAGPNKAGETKLVFDKIGDRYFLRQVWSSNSGQGLQVPASKQEKEVLSATRSNGGGAVETVIVALR
jgi:hypothetical protein